MNDELTEHTAVDKPPRVVELMGPAGAGKTTLLRALSQTGKQIQPDIRLSRIGNLPYFISNTVALLPTYLRQYRQSRWFNRREIRSMVYLKAWLYVLRQQASNPERVTVLDHGPIYRLAVLREFGPEITRSRPYKRWWASLLDQWTATLDTVIWLDAPNAILLERIRVRESRHAVKGKGEQEAYEFLTRYRTALEQILTESLTNRPVTLLRFNTNQDSLAQIVERVLAELDSQRSHCQ